MHRFLTLTCFVLISSLVPATVYAKPASLMQMIGQWQFPGSTLNGAEMADGATIGPDGNRTTQSLACKTVMTTDAPVDEVLAHYRSMLVPRPSEVETDASTPESGRSVVFSDDSASRPFAMHTILVNTADSSTTLVITRGKGESKTHIGWKHYLRF